MLELFGYANLQTRRWVRHNRPGSSQTPELHGRIPADIQLGGRSPAAQSLPLPVAPFTASTQQEVWAKHLGQPVEITNSIGMKLTLIPPGEFMMGSPASEAVRHDDEAQHRVRLTKPYYLGMYEVTQGEYERVIGTNPSEFARSGDSSERVSGQDTSRFPVERVSSVGSYASNGFGLFDMHGNVREWCSDWYDSGYYANSPTDDPTGLTSGSFRVFRGGGWFSDARSCRSAFRYGLPPSIRINSLGFRLAFSSVDQSGR